MERPSDDEYGTLDDLMGGTFEDPGDDETAGSSDDPESDVGVERSADAGRGEGGHAVAGGGGESESWAVLPEGLDPQYVEAFRRGYERARRGEALTLADEPAERAVEPAERAGEPTERAEVGPSSETGSPSRQTPPGPSGEAQPDPSTESTAEPGPAASGQDDELTAGPAVEPVPTPAASGQHDEPTRRIEPADLAAVRESVADAADRRPGAGTSGTAATRGEGPADPPTVAVPAGSPGRGASAWAAASSVGLAAGQALRNGLGGPGKPRDGRLVAAGLGVLALLVVVAAFGVGRLFADDGSAGDDQARVARGEARGGASAYEGPLRSVPVTDATATCQASGSVDAAGNPVTYEPAKAYDADFSTAWRCGGSGVGQRLRILLPKGTVVGQVGLVPGYAKTDPATGADRYAENNRITKVRWRFDDGTTFVQRMKGDPRNRRMRLMRVPETRTQRVVLQILASRPGPRDTVAISELRIAAPAG